MRKQRKQSQEQTFTDGSQETSLTANQNSKGTEDTTEEVKDYIQKFGVRLPIMNDNDRISSKRNKDKEGSTGSRIRNWCRQNKNLVYLGAAVVTLGAAYTVVMMRKKK